MNGRETFIYGLVDPDTRIVRYVGQSIHPKKRFREHVRSAALTRDHPILFGNKERWICSLLDRGMEPELIIFEQADGGSEADECEKRWIERYNEHLLNATGALKKHNYRPMPRREHATEGILPIVETRPVVTPPEMLPEDISGFRARHDISQGRLAKMLGVHYSSVSLWESGKRSIPPFVRYALERIEQPPSY